MNMLCHTSALLLACGVCSAQPAIGEVLGTSPGSGTALAMLGDMLCLGSGHTLYLEDLQDPGSPVPLGSVRLPGEPQSIALKDSLAYLGLGYNGLVTVDLRNPGTPQLLDHFDWVQSDRLLVEAEYLHVMGYSTAVRTFRLTNPAEPAYSGVHYCESTWMAVNNRHLFVGDRNNGILILDRTNPANPTLAGTLDLNISSFPGKFAVTDSLLLAFGLLDSLHVFGTRDPAHVELLATLAPHSNRGSIATLGNTFLLPTQYDGILLGDLSDGTNPVVFGSLPGDGFRMITFDGSRVTFMDNQDILTRYDLSDVANPVLRGRTVQYHSTNAFASLGRLTVSAARSGVHLEDLTEPDRPRWLGRIIVPGDPRLITLVDSVAFVGTRGSGLQRVDLGDIHDPVIAPMDATGNVTWMEPDGNTLNVLYDTGLLRSLDVSDPGSPVEIGTLATNLSPWRMAIEGRILCLSDDYVFSILDLAAEGGPQVVYTMAGEQDITNLVLKDSLLYMEDMLFGMRIFDVRDPANPVQLGSIDSGYYGTGLRYEEGRLYSCEEYGYTRVMDVRDPLHPVVLAQEEVCFYPVDIQPGSGVVFIPTCYGGIWTLRFPGLFPPEPAELAIATRGPDVILTWEQPEASEWNVYRLSSPFELPGPSNRMATVSTPAWTDAQALGRGAAFYRVTAVVE